VIDGKFHGLVAAEIREGGVIARILLFSPNNAGRIQQPLAISERAACF
jgi:hypothetical protein